MEKRRAAALGKAMATQLNPPREVIIFTNLEGDSSFFLDFMHDRGPVAPFHLR